MKTLKKAFGKFYSGVFVYEVARERREENEYEHFDYLHLPAS